MNDSIRGLTAEGLLEVLLFDVGNLLVASVGYGEMAKEKLDSTHPAFSPVTNALQASERAVTLLRQVGGEWLRRKAASRADQ